MDDENRRPEKNLADAIAQQQNAAEIPDFNRQQDSSNVGNSGNVGWNRASMGPDAASSPSNKKQTAKSKFYIQSLGSSELLQESRNHQIMSYDHATAFDQDIILEESKMTDQMDQQPVNLNDDMRYQLMLRNQHNPSYSIRKNRRKSYGGGPTHSSKKRAEEIQEDLLKSGIQNRHSFKPRRPTAFSGSTYNQPKTVENSDAMMNFDLIKELQQTGVNARTIKSPPLTSQQNGPRQHMRMNLQSLSNTGVAGNRSQFQMKHLEQQAAGSRGGQRSPFNTVQQPFVNIRQKGSGGKVTSLSSRGNISDQGAGVSNKDEARHRDQSPPLSFKVVDTRQNRNQQINRTNSNEEEPARNQLNEPQVVITKDNPLFGYMGMSYRGDQDQLGISVKNIGAIHGRKRSLTGQTKFSKIPLKSRIDRSPGGKLSTMQAPVVKHRKSNSRFGTPGSRTRSRNGSISGGRSSNYTSQCTIKKLVQPQNTVQNHSLMNQWHKTQLLQQNKRAQLVTAGAVDITGANASMPVTATAANQEGFEFEPVKHQDGIAFVSPVIKRETTSAIDMQEKRSSMFVPRVMNKRMQQSNMQQRLRIKRGSNVSKISANAGNITPMSSNGAHENNGVTSGPLTQGPFDHLGYFQTVGDHQSHSNLNMPGVYRKNQAHVGSGSIEVHSGGTGGEDKSNIDEPQEGSIDSRSRISVVTRERPINLNTENLINSDNEMGSQNNNSPTFCPSTSMRKNKNGRLYSQSSKERLQMQQQIKSDQANPNINIYAGKKYKTNPVQELSPNIDVKNIKMIVKEQLENERLKKQQIDQRRQDAHKLYLANMPIDEEELPNMQSNGTISRGVIGYRVGSGHNIVVSTNEIKADQLQALAAAKHASGGTLHNDSHGRHVGGIYRTSDAQKHIIGSEQSNPTINSADQLYMTMSIGENQHLQIQKQDTGSMKGMRKIDLKQTMPYSSRESSLKKSPDPGTRRIPESVEDVSSQGAPSPRIRLQARPSDEHINVANSEEGAKDDMKGYKKHSTQVVNSPYYKTISVFDQLTQKQSSMAKLKNRIGGHQSSEENMMDNTQGGIIISASAESFANGRRKSHFIRKQSQNNEQIIRKSSTSKNEDLYMPRKKSDTAAKLPSSNAKKPHYNMHLRLGQTSVVPKTYNQLKDQLQKQRQYANLDQNQEPIEIILFSGRNPEDEQMSPEVRNDWREAAMPETMISSVETFAKNRMDSRKGSTAHPTEESPLKIGRNDSPQFKLSQWDRFAGSFKSANETIRFEQQEDNQNLGNFNATIGGASNIFSVINNEQLLIDNLQRGNSYALMNKGGQSRPNIKVEQKLRQANITGGQSTPALTKTLQSRASTRLRHANTNSAISTADGQSSNLIRTAFGTINPYDQRPMSQETTVGDRIRVQIHKRAMDAPRITLKRTEQAIKQGFNNTQTIEKKETQSDVYVYGRPVVHWVQTMRDKLTKAKTAGFDHDKTFLSRRANQTGIQLQSNATIMSNQPDSANRSLASAGRQRGGGGADTNQIKIPEHVAAKVLQEGNLDYRPTMGAPQQIIQRRKTTSNLASFFRSGKSLNKAYREWNTKVPAANRIM